MNDQLQQIQQVLHILYLDPCNDKKHQADLWLKEYQNTIDAWQSADQLLQLMEQGNSNIPEYVYFFAAQTLHNKARTSFHELPSEAWIPLRDSIVEHIKRHETISKVVRTQLSLALVLVSIQMSSWHSFVPYFFESFVGGEEIQMNKAMCLLDILTVVPEEACDEFACIGHDRQKDVEMEIVRHNQHVLDFLTKMLQHAMEPRNVVVQNNVFRCLQSWIKFGKISPANAAENPVIQSLTSALQDPELFDIVVEVLVVLFRQYDNAGTDTEIVQLMVPQVMQLKDYFISVAQKLDTDACLGLCRVFTEMSESYVPLIVAAEDMNQSAILELLLGCMSYPEVEVADITFNFWFRFTGEILRMDADTRTKSVHRHQNCLTKLAASCIQTLQFPDEFQTYTEDKQKDFKLLRQDLGDILQDCCKLIGTDNVLQQSMHGLQQHMSSNSAESWKLVEAMLYTIRSVANEVHDDENTYLPHMFAAFPHLSKHPGVQYTATLVINRYSRWVHHHPEFILPLYSFAHKNLGSNCSSGWLLDSAAAMTMKSLVVDNISLLGSNILDVYHRLPQVAPNLPLDDANLLLRAVCKVISQMDYDALMNHVAILIRPIAMEIKSGAEAKHTSAVTSQLKRLRCVFEGIQVNVNGTQGHPFVLVLTELWPVFTQMSSSVGQHDEVAEALCSMLKRVVRACKEHFLPLLDPCAELLITCFQRSLASAYLYMSSVLVQELSSMDNTACKPTLEKMVHQLVQGVLQLLRNDLTQCETYPDVVVEYFYFAERCLKYAPLTIGQPELLQSTLELALCGISMQHRSASKSVFGFLDFVVKVGCGVSKNRYACVEIISQLVQANLQLILKSCVVACFSNASISRLDGECHSVASVLVVLREVYGVKSIAEALSQALLLPTCAAITDTAKATFINEFMAAQNENGVRRCIRWLARSSRNQ